MTFKNTLKIAVLLMLFSPVIQAASFFSTMVRIRKWIDSQIDHNAIVFIGDSITQGLNVLAVSNDAVNFGISGETSDQSLEAIKNYQSIKRVRTVVLAVGVNDLLQAKKTKLLMNYAKLLAAIPFNVRIIASGILPFTRHKGQSTSADLLEVNRTIKNLCLARGLCVYVDNSKLPNAGIGSDGLHLNTKGYAVWTANLINALKICDKKWPL